METFKLGLRLAVAIVAMIGLLCIQAQMRENEEVMQTACHARNCT